MYRLTFIVEGTGQFPLEMLAEERAWPDSMADVRSIRDNAKEPRRVHLTTLTQYRYGWVPRDERWKGFGWRFVIVRDVVKNRLPEVKEV